MVSRDEAMTLRKLSCVSAAILAWGCTPAGEPSSPQGAAEVADAAPFQPLRSFPSQRVQDPLGRWQVFVESESKPVTLDEGGFVQVSIPTSNGSTLNCFVYDVVLDSGQAVVRFLRAASVGLTFHSFQITQVEALNGAPVVFFAGDYSAQRSEESSGTLSMMISPRLQFPIVCSHDSPQQDAAFHRISRDFLETFRVTEAASPPSTLSEVWRLEDESGPLGFWFYGAYQSEDGSITSLSLSSLFRWGQGALHTSDTVAVEVQDATGLSRGRWLQMRDTEKLQEITLERQPAEGDSSGRPFHYRFIGEKSHKPVRGELHEQNAMQSSIYLHQLLEAQRRSPAEGGPQLQTSWSQYIPELNLNAATQVAIDQVQPELVRLRRSEKVLQIRLGEAGLPAEITGTQESGDAKVHLVLLDRTSPTVSVEPR